MTVLDALLDARLTEAFAEAQHPRGRGGKWIPKVGDKATYFHALLGRSLDVKVHTSPDQRGYMRIKMPAADPFNGEVRRVHASSVSHPSGIPMAMKSQLGHSYDAGRAAQNDRAQILAKSPSAAAELRAYKGTQREAKGGRTAKQQERFDAANRRAQVIAQDRHRQLENKRVAAEEEKARQVEAIQREYRTAGDAVITARKSGDPTVIRKAEQRWTKAKDRLRNVTAEQRAAYARARPNAFK